MTRNETIKARTKAGDNFVVREARSDADYHSAYPIIRQLIPDLDMQTYAQRVYVARATGYRMFVAEIANDIIGIIGIVPNYNLHDGYVTYIEHVVIDNKHRGHGYGTALIKFAEQRAREEGCKLIQLDTDIGHDEAENLYKKNGYAYIGKYHQKELDHRNLAAPLPVPVREDKLSAAE